jgi:hypothetical protein
MVVEHLSFWIFLRVFDNERRKAGQAIENKEMVVVAGDERVRWRIDRQQFS